MNKTLLLLTTLLFSFSSPLAAQIETLEQFQTKVKGVYYDPRNEGMKGFRCQVKSTLMDKVMPGGLEGELIKGFLKLDLRASYDQDGIKLYPAKFNPPESDKSEAKLAEWFEIINEMRNIVEMELQSWAIIGFPGKLKEGEVAITNVKFKKTDEGFELSGKDRSGEKGTFFFDPNLKLTMFKLRMRGEKEVTIHLEYEKSPKGLRLRSCDWIYGKYAYKASADYRSVDDYYVPKEIKVTLTGGDSKGVSIFDLLKFDKYNIDW